ncbi:MAG: hypothetical protein IJV98_00920 [Clostridia bacterium]|nr:hypothetical protein [Clostridia bacterium]
MSFFGGLTGKKKNVLLLAVGLIGIALILFGSAGKHGTENNTEISEKKDVTMEYIERIENKIGNIAEEITGSGRVRVIVSVASGSEFQYITNEESREGHTSKEYVTVRSDGGADQPVLLREIYPEIVGVSVACRGGDSPEIQEKLIRVISTTFGLGSNRICIVGIS